MSELPPLEILHAELSYDPLSGVLRWKKGKQGRQKSLIAGYTYSGYCRVFVCGKSYQAHRIAFAMYHQRDIVGEIDHIDGNPSNNSIVNLREATRLENARNRVARGFQRHPKRKKNPFQARIKANGKLTSLGVFPTEELASAAYIKATKKYFGKFSSHNREFAYLANEIAPEIGGK